MARQRIDAEIEELILSPGRHQPHRSHTDCQAANSERRCRGEEEAATSRCILAEEERQALQELFVAIEHAAARGAGWALKLTKMSFPEALRDLARRLFGTV